METKNQIEKVAIRTSAMSILGNLVLAIAKAITGILGNSFALIADAIESGADVFASLAVWFGLRYSARPPDENHPYGHGRVEVLITFVVVGMLFISATVIVVQGINNLRSPQEMPESFTLWVLGAIIIIKELFYRYEHKKSIETHSSSLRADAWHHRSDAISSLTAFAGISLALLLGEGYEKADDIAAIVGSFVIYYNAYLIFRPALGEFMDEDIHAGIEKSVRKSAASVVGVKGTEKCMVRKMGMRYLVDLHLEVDGDISVSEGHIIAGKVKRAIIDAYPHISNVLIHVEPAEASD
jgi:cation diffusion facilitator family transporter